MKKLWIATRQFADCAEIIGVFATRAGALAAASADGHENYAKVYEVEFGRVYDHPLNEPFDPEKDHLTIFY